MEEPVGDSDIGCDAARQSDGPSSCWIAGWSSWSRLRGWWVGGAQSWP